MLCWGLLERIILAVVKVDEGGFFVLFWYVVHASVIPLLIGFVLLLVINCGTNLNCWLGGFFLVSVQTSKVTHVTYLESVLF